MLLLRNRCHVHSQWLMVMLRRLRIQLRSWNSKQACRQPAPAHCVCYLSLLDAAVRLSWEWYLFATVTFYDVAGARFQQGQCGGIQAARTASRLRTGSR
jgi:hypothetical protein